jgi:sulfate permease, SulP family
MNTERSKESQKPIQGALRLNEVVIPAIRVARTILRRWLRADLVAGVTTFAMLVPQGMAYGELAGVVPVAGLYAALGAMLGYALIGSSRQLMLGPEAASAILAGKSGARVSE